MQRCVRERAAGTADSTLITAAAGDTLPPQSSVLALLPSTAQAQFIVNWLGIDNVTVQTSLAYDLQYKDGLTGTWTTWLSATTSNSAVFTGENGHTYYFQSRGKDAAGNVKAYPDNPDSYTTIEYTETKNNPQQQEGTIWGMFSIPLDAEDKTPQAVLGDNVKNETLQLYYWNPNSNSDATWQKYTAPTSVEIGQGYWLYVASPATIDVKGKPWKQNANFEKRLYAGWNMVGCPFLYSIDWKNVQFRYGGVTKTLPDAVAEGLINNYTYTYGKNAQGQGDWSQTVYPNGLIRP